MPPRVVRFAFSADESFYRMLEQARCLLRHKYPDGRLEGVLGDALQALIERRDPVLRWLAAMMIAPPGRTTLAAALIPLTDW